jgi:hypothetical protein
LGDWLSKTITKVKDFFTGSNNEYQRMGQVGDTSVAEGPSGSGDVGGSIFDEIDLGGVFHRTPGGLPG